MRCVSVAASISLVVTGPTSLVRSSVSAEPSSPFPDKGEEQFTERLLVVPTLTLQRRRDHDAEECFSGAVSDSEVGRKKMSKAATVGASSGKRLAVRLASTEVS